MPTHEETDSFWRDYARLTPEQVRRFREDLPSRRFRAGLRVRDVEDHPGIFEMTWAGDGRATFMYGTPVREGEIHIIWRRIGGTRSSTIREGPCLRKRRLLCANPLLWLDVDCLAVDTMRADPAIRAAAVIPDREPYAIYGLYQMQEDGPAHLDQYHVAHCKFGRIARRERDEIAVIDLAAHREASWPDGRALATLERLDGMGGPVH